MSKSPKKIGFIIKHHQPEAVRLALDLSRFILAKGASVLFADESASAARKLTSLLRSSKGIRVVPKKRMPAVTDLIVVLGGDGTYLSIARLIGESAVPIMGINMGQLGFLTEIKQDEALDAIDQILSGTPPVISNRSLLEVTLLRKNKSFFRGIAFNDAIIAKGAIARIISLEVTVNGQPLHTVRADGLIVSTPTGSTAYSLAAGGPILDPSVPALILTSICPHSLTQRPLVIPDTSEIGISLSSPTGRVVLTLDGQESVSLEEGDKIIVRRSKKQLLKLISSPTRDYFSLLREKLKFGLRD